MHCAVRGEQHRPLHCQFKTAGHQSRRGLALRTKQVIPIMVGWRTTPAHGHCDTSSAPTHRVLPVAFSHSLSSTPGSPQVSMGKRMVSVRGGCSQVD